MQRTSSEIGFQLHSIWAATDDHRKRGVQLNRKQTNKSETSWLFRHLSLAYWNL